MAPVTRRSGKSLLGGWLYLVLLLEFQATVDRAMAVRMLAYTAMLQQRLVADGALDEHGALPPVLPVVLYNGRRRWTAPVEDAGPPSGSVCPCPRAVSALARFLLLYTRRRGWWSRWSRSPAIRFMVEWTSASTEARA